VTGHPALPLADAVSLNGGASYVFHLGKRRRRRSSVSDLKMKSDLFLFFLRLRKDPPPPSPKASIDQRITGRFCPTRMITAFRRDRLGGPWGSLGGPGGASGPRRLVRGYSQADLWMNGCRCFRLFRSAPGPVTSGSFILKNTDDYQTTGRPVQTHAPTMAFTRDSYDEEEEEDFLPKEVKGTRREAPEVRGSETEKKTT